MVSGGYMTLDTGSVVNASGLGLHSRLLHRESLLSYGGSNGGQGGYPQCASPPDLSGKVVGFADSPWDGWAYEDIPDEQAGYGRGVGPHRGGGRIFLSSQAKMSIGGLVVSDGSNALCFTQQRDCAAGAGGTVVIEGDQIVCEGVGVSAEETPAISVAGGSSFSKERGAGGGGRIAFIAVDRIVVAGSFDIRVHGGRSVSRCGSGAAGTVLRVLGDLLSASIQISNCPAVGACEVRELAIANTPLNLNVTNASKVRVIAVQVNKYALVNATHLVIAPDPRNDAGIFLGAGRIIGCKYMSGMVLQLKSGSSINCANNPEIHIDSDASVDASSSISFQGIFKLKAFKSVNIAGSITRQDSALSVGEAGLLSIVHIVSPVLFVDGTIKAEKLVFIGTQYIQISNTASTAGIPQCSTFNKTFSCEDIAAMVSSDQDEKLYNADFSVLVAVMNPPQPLYRNISLKDSIYISSSGLVSGSSILMCGDMVRIDGTVTSTGQGCLADSGTGKGCSASSGSGASHGGLGGSGIGCDSVGPTYDNPGFPILSGSGGGSSLTGLSGGSGGGVSVVRAYSLLQLNGEVKANGATGNGLDPSMASSGGGGAGGSVQILARTVCGNSLGNVSASGGSGGIGGKSEQ